MFNFCCIFHTFCITKKIKSLFFSLSVEIFSILEMLFNMLFVYQVHTGKCIRRFGGIYACCRYFIDRKWYILVLILYRNTCHMPKGL